MTMSEDSNNNEGSARASVLTLVEDRVFAIGGSVSLEHTPIFVAEGTTGWMPFQCYVVQDGDARLIVDTGLPSLAATVRDGLDRLVGPDGSCAVFATRREVENLDNLSWILRRYSVETFYMIIGHMIAPLGAVTFFDELDDAHEVAMAEAHIAANEEVPIEWIRRPDPVKLGSRTLVPVRSPIAILSTYWLYDPDSGTLFSSDLWGFLPADAPGGPERAARSPGQVTVERLQAHIEAKFDLLCGTDTTWIRDALRKIAREHRIERVCPSYGCIIEGRDAVDDLIEKTIVAVERVGRRPRRNLLQDFLDSENVKEVMSAARP